LLLKTILKIITLITLEDLLILIFQMKIKKNYIV